MTIEQCEEAYTELGRKIFEPKYSGLDPRRGRDYFKANGKFDSSVLEVAIKEVIAENCACSVEEASNAMLMEEDAKCKVLANLLFPMIALVLVTDKKLLSGLFVLWTAETPIQSS